VAVAGIIGGRGAKIAQSLLFRRRIVKRLRIRRIIGGAILLFSAFLGLEPLNAENAKY